jgi:hypothetical protein
MDKNKKYQILKYSLLSLLIVFSFFLWRSVDRAIFVKEASVWMAPINWASLFFLTLALAIFLIKERGALLLAIALAFFSVFVFSFSAIYLLIIFLAILLMLVAEGKIRDDFHSRIKIDLGKNIRSGSAYILFALGLAIASQYYFATKDLATEKFLPHFEVGKETNGLVLKMISGFYPQAKDLGNDQLTVDQFIFGIYEKQKKDSGLDAGSFLDSELKNLDPSQKVMAERIVKDAEKNGALSEGKKQLSQIALREVKGDEKISDVFSEIVNKKVNGYFMPNLGNKESSALFSGIIAIVLLLTVTSLGSFLMFFWILAVKIIFFIFKKSGAISVVMVPAEKEVVE